jgi:hypothetical protein
MSKSSLFCYLCGKPIKFDNEYINERTGKKIPLDAETNEPHNCPVRRSQQEQQQSQPSQLQQQQPSQQQEHQFLDKETGLRHQCQ